MFRHILSYCIVVSLFMIAAGMVLAANTVVINFEDPSYVVNMPIKTLTYPTLTVTFSTTNPNNCRPYLGDWGNLRQGWLCGKTSTEDVTVPPFAGGNWFLTWVECDARTYDMVVDFLPAVDKFEGSIFDIDEYDDQGKEDCKECLPDQSIGDRRVNPLRAEFPDDLLRIAGFEIFKGDRGFVE